VLEIGMFDEEAEVNPLTLSDKSCSDWVENFSVACMIYLKNYNIDFYLALLTICKNIVLFCC
jgi:hypothetical protein